MPGKRKVKVIIDTNLFVSFLIGKRLSKLKSAIVNEKVELIFSEQNITELKTVTSRPKLKRYFDSKDVSELIELIYLIGKIVEVDTEPSICRDPKDNFLLGLSEQENVDYLISGDKDLLVLENYKSTKIVSISEFEHVLLTEYD